MDDRDISYTKLDEDKDTPIQNVPIGVDSFHNLAPEFERVKTNVFEGLNFTASTVDIDEVEDISKNTQTYSQLTNFEVEELHHKTSSTKSDLTRSKSLLEYLEDGFYSLFQSNLVVEENVNKEFEDSENQVSFKKTQTVEERIYDSLNDALSDRQLIEKALNYYNSTTYYGDKTFSLLKNKFYQESRKNLEEICESEGLNALMILKWIENYEENWKKIYLDHLEEKKIKIETEKKEKEKKEKQELAREDLRFIEFVEEFKKGVATEKISTIEPFVKFKKLDTAFKEIGCFPSIEFKGYNYGFQGYKFLDYEPMRFKDQIVLHRETFYINVNERIYDDCIPWTPLQYAIACGRINMVKELVKRGATIWIKDKTGRNAMDIARMLNHNQIYDYLESKMKNFSF